MTDELIAYARELCKREEQREACLADFEELGIADRCRALRYLVDLLGKRYREARA